MNGIGKQKLSVVVLNDDAISITELVSAGNKSYRPCVIDSLTKKQALALGLLLIKAAQS
jgi:hypothetical protein